MAEKETKTLMILGIKWWHLIGGGGTIIGALFGLLALWQHFDLKAHDQRILEETKRTIEGNKSDISINLPDVNIDVDGTAEYLGEKATDARKAIGDAAQATKTKSNELLNDAGEATSGLVDSAKKYWGSLRNPFEAPEPECEYFATSETVNDVCPPEEVSK